MNASTRTRQFYLTCLLVRAIGFVFLVNYAVNSPAQFLEELAAGPLSFSPLTVIWLTLMLSMVFRLFPSRTESLGCQKGFAGRFRPTGKPVPQKEVRNAERGALRVMLSWIALNSVFFLCYRQGFLDSRFMVCLASFYSVCDIICILFFCPFQSWIMGNRCCTTCRIYNWDYLMICTPLLCLSGAFALSACLLAIVLFLQWELTYILRRERFFEHSNEALQCRSCQEQLCKYKSVLADKKKTHPSQ